MSEELFRNLDNISRECSDFIRTTQHPMYRGMMRDGIFHVMSVREDRRPTVGQTTMDGPFRRFIYNYLVEKETGIDRLRLRSVFMTGEIQEARKYGNPYVIFPPNRSRFMVSEISDSISLLAGVFNAFKIEFNDALVRARARDQEFSYVVEQYYRDGDEEVFRGTIDWDDNVERMDYLGPGGYGAMEDAIRETQKSSTWKSHRPIEVETDQLNYALRNGYEIMMFDTTYYYAILGEEMISGFGGDYMGSTEDAYANLLDMIEEGF